MTINSINILIPLKNEEMSIDNLIESLKPILEKIKKRTVITLINDHSSDKTMDILVEKKKKIKFSKNL